LSDPFFFGGYWISKSIINNSAHSHQAKDLTFHIEKFLYITTHHFTKINCMDKKIKKAASPKKDMRAKLSVQLQGLLAEFTNAVHDKKIQKLVKKAAKLLADGLHHNKPKPSVVKKKAAPKKKAVVKKAAPKKAVVKKK
jgi:hypothetical protein